MRRILALALLLGVLPGIVGAATDLTGRRATCQITVDIPPAAVAHLMQATGTPLTAQQLSAFPAIPPTTVDCNVIWSGSLTRLEMLSPDKLLSKIVLADQATGLSYELDPLTHQATATQRDSTDMLGISRGEGGLTSLTQDYAAIQTRMRAMKGAIVTELGAREVGGYACRGLGFTLDLTQYQGELSASLARKGDTQGLGMVPQVLSAMSPATGEVWISDKYNIAVLFKVDLGGIKVDVALSEVQDWTGPASTFAVPAEYLVQDPAHPTLGVLERLRPWHTGRPGGV